MSSVLPIWKTRANPLVSLHLENYRGFDSHTIPLQSLTIAVGCNNAGKSTFVEALRLISLCANRAVTMTGYRQPPDWLRLHAPYRGVKPRTDHMGIDFETICTRYGEPPAKATARFENGTSIVMFVGPNGDVFGTVKSPSGKQVVTRLGAHRAGVPDIQTLPQVAPLRKEETVLERKTVERALASALAPLHFRNQINLMSEYYDDFVALIESTWKGIGISDFIGRGGMPHERLALLVRDSDFVAEAGCLGHGFQVWLQIMWFLARSREACIVILDEPDVYLHADLQRKLLRLLRNRHPQTILTSHSAELLSEVKPQGILIIDKGRTKSAFASSIPMIQNLVDEMGCQHNIQMAKLWSGKRLILVEGTDISQLDPLHAKLFPNANMSISGLPNMAIGGWSGWQRAHWSADLIHSSFDQDVVCYCLLDRDYHTESQVSARYAEAEERGIHLHIWKRKEIESYLLVPSAIRRVIASRTRRNGAPTSDQVLCQIQVFSQLYKQTVFNGLATCFQEENPKWVTGTCINEAEAELGARLDRGTPLWHLVSGKKLFARLSEWASSEFGVSFAPGTVVRELLEDEIPDEIRRVLASIEYSESFSETDPLGIA